jgi:16S rRNA U1498 N3-methylase RsmE
MLRALHSHVFWAFGPDKYLKTLNAPIALADGDFTSAAPTPTGDSTVGTTRLDASKWGLGRVVLAIGAERGWTDTELAILDSAGFARVGMGQRTLSSPVAVMAAISICQEALR